MKGKRVFSKNETQDKNVLLNWRNTHEEEFSLYAEAYHLVAKEALAAFKKYQNSGFHKVPIDDFRACPIVFLYRHALELYMKAVILTGAPMLMMKSNIQIKRDDLLNTHS